MAFLTEPVPPRGQALPVLPGVARIVAANPGPFTYHGTNTYLIDDAAGTTVLDPGPNDPAHVAHILAATGGRVARILLSHTHPDHLGAVPALKAATGAPVWSFHTSQDPAHTPDRPLGHNDTVAEDAARAPPAAIVIDSLSAIPDCAGQPFSLVDYFSRHPLFAELWSHYEPAGQHGRYTVYTRRD